MSRACHCLVEDAVHGSGAQTLPAGEAATSRLQDVARLSPLLHRPINFQGRYALALSEAVAQGALRPRRAPHEQEAES